MKTSGRPGGGFVEAHQVDGIVYLLAWRSGVHHVVLTPAVWKAVCIASLAQSETLIANQCLQKTLSVIPI